MAKLALFLVAVLLFAAPVFSQTSDSDPDIPVLKRRPEPTEGNPGNSPDVNQPNEAGPDSPTSSTPPATPAPRQPAKQQPAPSLPSASSESVAAGHAMTRGQPGVRAQTQDLSYHAVLTRGGGTLRITVNDLHDSVGAGQVSVRLREAAARLARGDFSNGGLLQLRGAPGAAVLRQMRGKITFTSHGIEDGAELIISSSDTKAVEAIHQFLHFQAQSLAARN